MTAPIARAAARWLLPFALVVMALACDVASDTAAPADPGVDAAADVQASADIAAPAQGLLSVVPAALNFDGIPVGDCKVRTVSLINTGQANLKILALELSELPAQVQVTWLSPPQLAGQSKPGGAPWPLATPVELAPQQTAGLAVQFCRSDLATFVSALQVHSDAGKVALVIDAQKVSGSGLPPTQSCPTAVAKVAEGGEVVPHTVLHLSSAGSKSPSGLAISKYEWAVKQPAGSNQPLSPGGNAAEVTMQADLPGTYAFCLSVWDAQGAKSCAPACVEVLVVPGNDMVVELTWVTPGDDDPDDKGAGADLDLHVAHPMAQGLDRDCDGTGDPWFSNPWDAFWFNTKPAWGEVGSDDDPSLSGDDSDGAGPETLQLTAVEGKAAEPVAYSIGVHYWHDHGLGASLASVRIWALGGLAVHIADVKLNPGDMWYVGKSHWPNTMSGGTKAVLEPCKQKGQSCAGGKTKMWQSSGDPCITPCYKDNAFTAVATKPMVSCDK